MSTTRLLHGDCRAQMATLPAGSVQTVVTSPPYYGLRDYGVDGQIGLEPSPDEYVAQMVAVFAEARRVLRDDGTLWLNLGDSYAAPGGGYSANSPSNLAGSKQSTQPHATKETRKNIKYGLASKQLLLIPVRVALALQDDGWYLRSHIVWHKPNPMPESVRDRPTSAWESVFLFAKQEKYFYNADAVRERSLHPNLSPSANKVASGTKRINGAPGSSPHMGEGKTSEWRNLRNVWTITPKPYDGAHFAVMPTELAETCIKAGSRVGDTILDPFSGAGTTGLAADRLGRSSILIELNPAYSAMSGDRVTDDCPLFANVAYDWPVFAEAAD